MENNMIQKGKVSEMEILEFTLNDNHYGINVDKVREILTYQPVTPVPNAESYVEGIFMPRDFMITVVNLKKYLSLKDSKEESGSFIVANFDETNVAFHVDEVVGIHKTMASDIIEPDATINADENGITVGVIKKEKTLVIMLDFDKIVETTK